MTIYIFSDHTWAELEVLRRYVHDDGGVPRKRSLKKNLNMMVRGGFHIDLNGQQGWIGPIGGRNIGGTPNKREWLFLLMGNSFKVAS